MQMFILVFVLVVLVGCTDDKECVSRVGAPLEENGPTVMERHCF